MYFKYIQNTSNKNILKLYFNIFFFYISYIIYYISRQDIFFRYISIYIFDLVGYVIKVSHKKIISSWAFSMHFFYNGIWVLTDFCQVLLMFKGRADGIHVFILKKQIEFSDICFIMWLMKLILRIFQLYHNMELNTNSVNRCRNWRKQIILIFKNKF